MPLAIERSTLRLIKKLDDRALREFVRNLSEVMVANVYARTTT